MTVNYTTHFHVVVPDVELHLMLLGPKQVPESRDVVLGAQRGRKGFLNSGQQV